MLLVTKLLCSNSIVVPGYDILYIINGASNKGISASKYFKDLGTAYLQMYRSFKISGRN